MVPRGGVCLVLVGVSSARSGVACQKPGVSVHSAERCVGSVLGRQECLGVASQKPVRGSAPSRESAGFP